MSDATYIGREDLRVLLANRGHDADQALSLIDTWVERGDTALVYENQDLGHPEQGSIVVVSYGGVQAQIEAEFTTEWPDRLPDVGGLIGWRYGLKHFHAAEADDPHGDLVTEFIRSGVASGE